MKTFIFEPLSNQCESTLAGTTAKIIIQRYPIFGHLDVVKKHKARPRYTLNNNPGGRIFLFISYLSKSVKKYWHRLLQSLHLLFNSLVRANQIRVNKLILSGAFSFLFFLIFFKVVLFLFLLKY